MNKLKLHYFDFHGGRGESIRLAMFIGGIVFEDIRIPTSDWPKHKPAMPLRALPVMEIDGRMMTQSNTINRYIGKLSRLYPDDPLQAALCDEVMDSVEDIIHMLVATFSMPDDEKKIAREKLSAGQLTLYLQYIESLLKSSGSEYFADNHLSVADLKVFVWIRSLLSGTMDYIPVDLVKQVSPLLIEHYERISNNPKVAAYYRNK